ncbi:MAG: acyl-CoA dehydrogenase domain-containing protein, partial [Cyanobacteria bacterium P01_D01_bin.36]
MRFEKEGRPQADLPFVEWSMTYAIAQIQQSFEELLNNLPLPVIGRFIHTGLRLNPLGKPPSDKLAQRVAQLMQQPDARERLTTGIYIPQDPEQALGRLENAYQVTQQAMPIFKQLKAAVKSGQLPKALAQEPIDVLIEAGLRAGLIDGAESNIAYAAEVARVDAIQVDSFSLEDYQNIGHSSHSVLSHSTSNASKRLSKQDYSLT